MSKKIKGLLCIIFTFFVILVGFVIWDFYCCFQPVQVDYKDLSAILEQEKFSEEDYRILFYQTGLGAVAIDDLKQNAPDFESTILEFQAQIQEKLTYKSEFIFFPTTTAETLRDEFGERWFLKIPPLQDGDILISKSTKTLIYRHGHAGLVLDGEEEIVLESMMIGTESGTYSLDLWKNFATLMILRPKDKFNNEIEKSLTFAENKLKNVPYNLLAGLFKKDQSADEMVEGTHCSHLVWQAYAAGGLDIDMDKGPLVTPYDIAGSQELTLVFAYGFGENPGW